MEEAPFELGFEGCIGVQKAAIWRGRRSGARGQEVRTGGEERWPVEAMIGPEQEEPGEQEGLSWT